MSIVKFVFLEYKGNMVIKSHLKGLFSLEYKGNMVINVTNLKKTLGGAWSIG